MLLPIGMMMLFSAFPVDDVGQAPPEWTICTEATPQLHWWKEGCVLASTFCWLADGTWAGTQILTQQRISPTVVRMTGHSKLLNTAFECVVEQVSPNSWKYTYKWDVPQSVAIKTLGLGLEVKVNRLEWADNPPDKMTAQGTTKFSWTPTQTASYVVEVQQAPAQVTQIKSTTRVAWFAGTLPAGHHERSFTVTGPTNVAPYTTLAQDLGSGDVASWPANLMLWTDSPVDLSYLNEKPSGKHGRMKAVGDQLVFEDGTPVKLWGANWAMLTIDGPRTEVVRELDRMAKLGFNLVRLHHHDDYARERLVDRSAPNSNKVNPDFLNNVSIIIAEAKARGMYVWLDMHTGLQLKDGDRYTPWGSVPGWKTDLVPHNLKTGNSPVLYFNPMVRRIVKNLITQYLSHRNPYTGLTIAKDPTVMGIQITNENDMTHHFGNYLNTSGEYPWHYDKFVADVQRWSAASNKDWRNVKKVWSPSAKPYLNDVEHRFNMEMFQCVRSAGYTGLLVGTNYWGKSPIYSLPACMDGDVIDCHSYGNAGALSLDPNLQPTLHDFITGASVGKPVTITEWNHYYPADDRIAANFQFLGAASVQGWDAPFLYAYGQDKFSLNVGSGPNSYAFNTRFDPALMATVPVAALAFRKGYIQEGSPTVVSVPRYDLFNGSRWARNSVALRTGTEQTKIMLSLPQVPELPWFKPVPAPLQAPEISLDTNLAEAPGVQVSENGEVWRYYWRGIHCIRTPKLQAASGLIGGESVDLDTLHVNVSSKLASISTIALDDKPVNASSKVLLTVIGRVKEDPSTGGLPFHSEPVLGTITIENQRPVKMVPLRSNGTEGQAILPSSVAGSSYQFTLPQTPVSHWYLIKVQ